MKKTFYAISLPLLIVNCLNAENTLKDNNSQENLDYLFQNESNFPLDDYLWNLKKNPKSEELPQINDIHKEIFNDLKKIEEDDKVQESKEENKEKKQDVAPTQPKIQQIDPYQKEKNRIRQLIRDGILSDRANTSIVDYSNSNKKIYGVDSFSNQPNINEATNEHSLFRMIRAGRMIPAVLTTAISSDLSGLVTAQIEEDIYATMGQAVMIPRGSKAIGFYQNNNTIGQNRLQIQWREIITPQGVNILLTNAMTSDSMGMSGALGRVNNKYFERYGIPYGISTATNMLLLSFATRNNGNVYSEQIYNQSQNDLSQVLAEVIQRQSEIQPTIEIKQGSRIFLVPTHHIWFPKPKNNEVMIQYFTKE
ncbi:DNA type IV secretion system protein ComB10 [Helicobacter winghamensis]|uniref:DNA type IV secretion system protein ComB10 n=1 Tax=Helicobacter winghamensis TaxID=157268 RepID=UPI0027A81366